MITGKMYNILKFVAQVVLPALATLYVTLAGLWGLPAVEAVVGSIVAFDTFLGVLLQISSTNYNSSTAQGTLDIQETSEGKLFSLELDDDPELGLEGKDRVVFKVKKTSKPKKAPRKAVAKRRRTEDT